MTEDINKTDNYLDSVAHFMVKHVPEYTELPDEAQHVLEVVWMAIHNNRKEFTDILNTLRKTRKKRVAKDSA